MRDIEHTIRERAYHHWLESGSHDGNADAHWLAAQREVLSASLGEIGKVARAPAKSKKTRSAPRKKRAA